MALPARPTQRYPVTASGFHLIGKETERGWEQAEDISTLLPSLVQYQVKGGVVSDKLQKQLRQIPLAFLRARRGEAGASKIAALTRDRNLTTPVMSFTWAFGPPMRLLRFTDSK